MAEEIDYDLEKLGLDNTKTYIGFDYWANEFVEPIQGQLKRTLAPASCQILAIREEANEPQLLSTSRHITQGLIDVRDEKWDAAKKTLCGNSAIVGNDPYELRIAIPATGDWRIERRAYRRRRRQRPHRRRAVRQRTCGDRNCRQPRSPLVGCLPKRPLTLPSKTIILTSPTTSQESNMVCRAIAQSILTIAVVWSWPLHALVPAADQPQWGQRFTAKHGLLGDRIAVAVRSRDGREHPLDRPAGHGMLLDPCRRQRPRADRNEQ